MDIDKLTPSGKSLIKESSFGSLMDIDKLTLFNRCQLIDNRFGSLMDIDKLTQLPHRQRLSSVLVL